jgi:predicted RNase H-like nuclease
MMLHGVPVAKMFLAGAPRLAASAVSILPCRPTADDRIAIETYPALAARCWLGRASYKSDGRAGQSADRRAARRRLVEAIASDARGRYGVNVALSPAQAQALVEDGSGDSLDAVLCALQAAWALGRANRGVPPDADRLEGWIVDPGTLQAASAAPGLPATGERV